MHPKKMLHQQLGLVAIIIGSLAGFAAAACHSQSAESVSDCDGALNTYFFSASKPAVSLAAGAGRAGTTRIQLQLRQEQVSSAMPIVTAAADGVTHDVVHTWQFLQNFALQSQAVATLNDKAVGQQPRRYPIPAFSIRAASALQQPNTAAAATATSRHLLDARGNLAQLPTHTAPTNVLLLATGSPVGAVADIMDVDMLQTSGDSAEPTIVLTLDVVHKPHTVSELQEHPRQTLDSHAHYHYYTPAGVTLDATKFLALLKTSAGSIADLHVFAKGCTPNLPICRNCTPTFDQIPANAGTPCSNGTGTCAGATCDGSASNPSACKCPSAPPPAECASGQVCRRAVGHCDVAEMCLNGACPGDIFKLNGARCPWYPRSHSRYGPYSVDLSSARASKVSADEAEARLASLMRSTPSYLREWPTCEGSCIDGMCALRWDHPACCSTHRRRHYYDVEEEYDEEEGRQLAASDGAEQGTTQGEGHWEGPEWYCWD